MASLSCLVNSLPITERLYVLRLLALEKGYPIITIDAGPMVPSKHYNVIRNTIWEGFARPIFTEPSTSQTKYWQPTGHACSSTRRCITFPILLIFGRALGFVLYSAHISAMISNWFLAP